MENLSSPMMWTVIALLSIATYLLRASFVLGIELIGELPPSVRSVLPFVPLAVLAALAAPDLAFADGSLSISLHNEYLVAGLVAFGIARKTESLILTVVAGMGLLWLLQLL
ncbi:MULTISPECIES: AzlD domain-containing protein [Natrialba]|uniref:AzlD domain-containing protein n=1 Tax=Natrialba swarupiae TaxID=2448032 RepID=A0A5D5ANG1_9EURY|nr:MULTISPECIES: AzlD domain-containing protein [Natrialba]MCW8173535.1 AzlD domain-containing protein [Natrialba swarupiae]MWV38485.1 AzlD domain-containing protein [Natrialba sp. INN-245]TYT62624.1 AzlD domain-containing protein [Natrialba swarupiae]